MTADLPPKPSIQHVGEFDSDSPDRLFFNSAVRSKRTRTVEMLAQAVCVAKDRKTRSKKNMEYKSGQIESIQIPAGWVKGESSAGIPQASYQDFHPPRSTSRIEFFYRGSRVPPQEGSFFAELLKNNHELSNVEFLKLGAILRGKHDRNQFELERAWVDDLNSKSVLMIEGRFKENDKRTLIVLIDADGSGTAVQELALVTPSDEYSEFKPDFQRSLDSIEWKQ